MITRFRFYQVDLPTPSKVASVELKKSDVITKKATPLSSLKADKKVASTITTKSIEKSKSTPNAHVVKGDIYEISSKFIPSREGKLHLCAFKDHTRRSIGYGTKSYPGECVTEEEAIKRFKEAIQRRVHRVESDYPTLLPYQQAALVSLLYNCNSCYLRAGKTVERGDFNRSSKIVAKFSGLKKRAKAERDLFNLGVIY